VPLLEKAGLEKPKHDQRRGGRGLDPSDFLLNEE
jgi:hypothetical protein